MSRCESIAGVLKGAVLDVWGAARCVKTSSAGVVVGCLLAAAVGSHSVSLASEIGQAVVSEVSQVNYALYLNDLLYAHDGDDRGLDGPEHDLARDNIAATFESFGLEVELFPVEHWTGTGYNVIATQVGTVYPDSYYVVGAHYDSVDNPGADDNASGVAGVLEIARVLSQYDTDYTIKYMAFDLEESGRVGSEAYTDQHRYDDVRGMIQFDMIAWNSGGFGCSVSSWRSPPWTLLVGEGISGYCPNLVVESGFVDVCYSDHVSFENRGFPACAVQEADHHSNPHYHLATDSVDTPGYISYSLGAQIARGVAGFMADVAGAHFPAGPLGDLNRDRTVDIADVEPFVLAVLDPVAYAAAYPEGDRMLADCYADGLVDGRDAAGFVQLLIGE